MSCNHRNEQNESTYQPSKRGKFEVCSRCADRFPCGDHSCAHYDCRQERGQQPRCYYCEATLTGPKGQEDSTWTIVHKRGGDVTTHYCCRDAAATTPRPDIVSRARGGYFPEPCNHTFVSSQKGPIEPELLKKMAAG